MSQTAPTSPPPKDRIPLGPFDVIEPIGKGGMADVWRGVHRRQQVPVAIKFVTGPWAQNPMYVETFRNEVRAIAGVDHPGIVTIFDHGEVPEETWAASGGTFRRGTPYIVMELASGGALDETELPLAWPDLKAVLLTLLDALGHAHSRGIIHRDLKPANVLLCTGEDIRPGLKLTDFGIAHPMKRASQGERDEVTEGTPEYMAPEQCRAQWRDYGPPTDLYALGCLAYELASGDPPFLDNSATMVFIHQIDTEPPKLDLRALGLPPEFEGWLWRLLQKRPEQRFQYAADAAWALAQIGTGQVRPGRLISKLGIAPAVQPVTRNTVTAGRQTLVGAALMSAPVGSPTAAPQRDSPVTERPRRLTVERAPLTIGQKTEGVVLAQRRAPPLPETWKRASDERWSRELVGTGLGLYGLRAIRLVDREPQRAALWETLRKTGELGRAHCFTLHGAAGNGKSALAQWLAQRASEVGGAHVMVGYHSQRPGPGDGVPRMVAQHLQCVGLTRAETLERIELKLRLQGVTDAYEWNALTELISPATERDIEAGARLIRFGSREEGHALVRRLLKRISRDRPAIVWLDDIHWSHDSLSFARYLLQQQAEEPVPVLLLCTARDEALVDLPEILEAMRGLTEFRGANDMPIGVLDPKDRAALVQQLLGLEGQLAQQVEERTDGNPLFAVQLVGDWVQRGVLEVGPRGFVLTAGAEAILPNNLYQFWASRIERLLLGKEELEPALQIGALLGREVVPKEWVAACEQAQVPMDVGILSQLFRERLAAPVEDGWTYTHGILRETFERRAQDTGRWEDFHRACVRMLRAFHAEDTPGIPERIGRHLYEAGDYEQAAAPLLKAAATRRVGGEYDDAYQLLGLREKALAAAKVPDEDARWGRGWVLESWIASNQGRIGRAWDLSQKAEGAARSHGWEAILPQALLGMAVAARDRGELSQADAITDEAFALYDALGNQVGMAHCLQGSGVIARLRGDMAWSQTQVLRALNLHERIGNAFGIAQCKQRMGEAVVRAGQTTEARRWFNEASAAYDAIASPLGVAQCLNGLGDAARADGDVASAAAMYHRAKKLLVQLGSNTQAYTTERLGLVALQRGKYKRARQLLADARAQFDKMERQGDARRVSVELLPCIAAAKEWGRWDVLASDIIHLGEEAGSASGPEPVHTDPDIAACAGWAAGLAADKGEPMRARALHRLEASQWRTLGRLDLTATAEAKLAALTEAGKPT